MKTRILQVGFLVAAFSVLPVRAAVADTALTLTPNKTERIDVDGRVSKIILSNPKVAEARPAGDGKSVVVTALTTGKSEIRIVRTKGTDLVYSLAVRADMSDLAREIKLLLSGVEGVTVKEVGDQIVLDGDVITKSDYDRVMKIAKAYKGSILNLAELDRTDLNKYVAEAIEKDIGLRSVKVKVSGDTATLEGIVFDASDKTMAAQKASQRCAKVVDLLKVEEINVEIDIWFIMIDTSDSKDSGMNVLETLSLNASFSASDSGTSYSVGGSLQAALKILESESKAKIIAKPHISTTTGKSGEFHSGGTEYFQVSGQTSGDLEEVKHGTILQVKPSLRGQDRVVADVTIEVSVPSSKPQGVFGLEKYKTSNTIMCKTGQSIIMSGLSQSIESQFGERTPLLGRVPIIRSFFSKRGKRISNKELVIAITPRPVLPVDVSGESSFGDRHKPLLEDAK